jgi:DNA (cytosine-5)-methyltransferase 1
MFIAPAVLISLVIYCHLNLVEKMIKIIDLFAGPGGLGEGFASYVDEETGEMPFSIVASVEKEASAHKTLQLRSFFRKFPRGKAPQEYYQYVRGEGITKDELFNLYKKESSAAIDETLETPRTLGLDNELIENRIKKALDGHVGPTIVIGGPPCQAYSLVGRSRNMGNAEYVAEKDPRHFLYKEYLKILALVTPDVFVMENVKGILSSKLDGEYIFPQIISDLKNPRGALELDKHTKYKIYSLVVPAADPLLPEYKDTRDFIIRAEKYGVAQARHRVILLGVRADIQHIPAVLTPSHQVNIEQVIGDLPALRSGLSKEEDTLQKWSSVLNDLHADLVSELDDLGMKDLSNIVRESKKNRLENLDRGKFFMAIGANLGASLPEELSAWLLDPRINGVLNHETRGHIRADLKRYLFCACFAKLNSERENSAPKSKEFLDSLAPNHKNWKSGKFTDRFRVQTSGRFATTITSHISKDGHYFIHYDPKQCRSLTVREAARIQSFPDNYFFEGNRTQQYVQVGNAVPPYLANQIAQIVVGLLSDA